MEPWCTGGYFAPSVEAVAGVAGLFAGGGGESGPSFTSSWKRSFGVGGSGEVGPVGWVECCCGSEGNVVLASEITVVVSGVGGST